MFSKADIRQITIAVNRERFNDVLYELGREEIVHVSRGELNMMDDENRGMNEREEEEIRNVLSEIGRLFVELGITVKQEENEGSFPGRQIFTQRDWGRDREYLVGISMQIDEMKRNREKLLSGMDEVSSRGALLKEIAETGVDMAVLGGMHQCSSVFGRITADREIELQGVPHFIRRYGNYVLVITLPSYIEEVNAVLRGAGFRDMTDIAASTEALQSMIRDTDRKIDALSADLENIAVRLSALGESYHSGLVEMYNAYSALDKTIEARKSFLVSDSVVFISGWLDMEKLHIVESLLRSVCGSGFMLMVRTRAESWRFFRDLPVVLKNNAFFRAFELLVKNAGTPGNRELDPTPVASIFYIIIFGVMFGDVGQGLTVALAGLLLRIYGLRSRGSDSLLPDAGIILMSIGISAAIFGLVYGSVFSNEHCMPALWFHPMDNMMLLFSAVIMAGAFFIGLGILLNIINMLLYGNFRAALLSTRGLPGLILYGGLVFFLVRYNVSEALPAAGEVVPLVMLPLLLILFRNILGFFFFGLEKAFPDGIFEYIMQTIVELLEMTSGFLSHSISFIRAGAFALSHAGLGMAVYSLAGMVSESITPASLAIILVGNIFIILLEGLVCGIQALRLEYYEFFGNFFQGDGVSFRPFSLKGVQQYR